MRRANGLRERGIFTPRAIFGLSLALAGLLLGWLSVTASPQRMPKRNMAAAANGAAVASPTWAITSSPNVTDQSFKAVTCVTSSDCWAVGSYLDADFTNQSLIQHWDGSAWSIVAGASVDTTKNNELNGITCTSTSNCWAVGYIGNSPQQTLIQRWNGTSWSLVASANNGAVQNVLKDVTCTSTTDCWAVGFRQGTSALQTLIERWNGVSWALVTSANSSTTAANVLTGVTCTSSTNCFAVGTRYATASLASLQQTTIQRWTGSSWAIVTSANESTARNNTLIDVTCASATDCTAVGYFVSSTTVFQTLIEKWNGTSWSRVTTAPNTSTSQNNFLFAVTCTATTDCWAVGSFMNANGFDQTLVERWNGTSWAIVSSPNTGSTVYNRLLGLACTSTTDCWAVGFQFNGSINQTLTERWNGTAWSLFTAPNIGITGSSTSNSLAAVTCISTNDCWAVGNYDPGSGIIQTLIEHWNGTNWIIINSPNSDPNQSNMLSGVACTSSSNCWAVGFYDATGAFLYQTLILRWDGINWSRVSSPNTAANQPNMLLGLACTSATQCFAVGNFVNASNITQSLVLQWNGMSWSIIPSPNTGSAQNGDLNAVACSSANDCWAVGEAEIGNVHQTMILRWNGSVWTAASSPNLSSMLEHFLNGVTCATSSDCFAVGNFFFNNVSQPLVTRWDGTSWQLFPSENTSGSENDHLNGVACSIPGDCSTVGDAVGTAANDPSRTLIEQYSDTYKVITSPNASGMTNSSLSAVTCLYSSDCWAVGFSQTGGTSQTLIERRTVPVLSITSEMRSVGGHIIISGKAVANSIVNIYAKSNLTDMFTLLDSTTADASGNFTYDDAGAASVTPPRRFYRVRYP